MGGFLGIYCKGGLVEMRKQYFIVGPALLALLLGFWLTDLFTEDRSYSGLEKRILAQKPDFTAGALLDGSYGEDYEEWLTDQFPFRDSWVGLRTRLELFQGKREMNGVYIGRDGFFFTESEETANWDALEEKLRAAFGEEKVSRIHVPAAGYILSDKLPPYLAFSGAEDAVSSALKEHKDEYIYFRTDHHWTMLGAYYAYAAWAEEQGLAPVSLDSLEHRVLKENFYGTHYARLHYAATPDTLDFYGADTDCEAVYDQGKTDVFGLYQPRHLDTDDAYRYFLDGNHALVEITSPAGKGHIAVLKDSFANNFIPYLTFHYKQITVIDPRYFHADMVEWLKEHEIDRFLILAQDRTVHSFITGSSIFPHNFQLK